MYNNSIETRNKIITADDLLEILSQMNEYLKKYKAIYQTESQKNEMLQYQYQTWTFKDFGSYINFRIKFKDNTEIKLDNYSSFLSIFNQRIFEINHIFCTLYLNYGKTNIERRTTPIIQKINIYIYEGKIEFNFSLAEEDNLLLDIYNLIENKINSAQTRYNKIIQKKNTIEFIVGLSISSIVSLSLVTLSLLIPEIRNIMFESQILYPVICILASILTSTFFGNLILSKYYRYIVPSKKYAGYDTENHKSIYKYDVDKFKNESEVLIGKNTNNLKYRTNIEEIYIKRKKYIPIELIIILVCSIIIFIISNIVK